VKFYGNFTINHQKLKDANIAGRTKTQNPHRQLNKTVSILVSAWYEPAELAQLSLAGKACPSIRGSLPKPKFPEDFLEAIESTSPYSPTEFKLIYFFFFIEFLIPKWETWHNIILTPEQIKTSVGDRLLACHTTERKSKQK
jgi:hypothetical protein